MSNELAPSKIGYFKFANSTSKRFSGQIAVNEYISFSLGKELGLPVAKTELVKIKGKQGIVSIKERHSQLINWNGLTERNNNIFNDIVEPERLVKMFVFDIWIANIDRNNRNIILYPIDNSDKYDFYLIDHGLSLLGSFQWKRVNWNQPYWDDVSGYNRRYLKGLPAFIRKNKNCLQSSIKELEELPNNKIGEIIDGVPHFLMTKKQKRIVYQFLIRRKKKLNYIVKRWLHKYFR